MQRRIVCSKAYDDPSPAADDLNEKLMTWQNSGWECDQINLSEVNGYYFCSALLSAPSVNVAEDKT